MTGSRRTSIVLGTAVAIALICGLGLGIKVADADPKVTTVSAGGSAAILSMEERETRAQLRRDIDALNERRAELRRQLAAVKAPSRRAVVARELGALYRDTASETGASDLVGRRELAQGLRMAADAYDALSGAVPGHRRRAYDRAAAGVVEAEDAVNDLLASDFGS